MSTIVAFVVSLALVAVFGVMGLQAKIVANTTRLDGFVSVQEVARQQLATELREESARRQGKHATEMQALEEKVRVLTEKLDAHKAETKVAFGLVVAKELQQVEELQHEVAKPVRLTAEQIAHLQAGQARIDLVVARLEGKVASVERMENMANITNSVERLESGQQNLTNMHSELAAQANETMTLLQALHAREESAALLATHREMGRTLAGHDAVLKQLTHKLMPLAVNTPPTSAASRPKLAPLAPHPKLTPLASTAQPAAAAPRPRRKPPAAAMPPAAAASPSKLTPLAATAAGQPVAAALRPKQHEPPTAAAPPAAAPPVAATADSTAAAAPPAAAPNAAVPPGAAPPNAAPPGAAAAESTAGAAPPAAAPKAAAPPTAAPPTAVPPNAAPPGAAAAESNRPPRTPACFFLLCSISSANDLYLALYLYTALPHLLWSLHPFSRNLMRRCGVR